MRFWFFAAGLCSLFFQTVACAEAPSDPLMWLGKISTASQRLNYVGTFTYQSGKQIETSRIAHRANGDGEFERLEVLDGSPREVIRSAGEVRCVLPDQRTVIIDQPGGRRVFPARLPASFKGLAESYVIRKGARGRVAGYEAQSIVLEPKDNMRYGHVLWAELKTGLLLKSRMVDARGDMIEQFTFSDLRIGGEVDSALLKPRFSQGEGWRVVSVRGDEISKADSGWQLRSPIPGFTLNSVVRRSLGADRGDAVHMVFGDGLAAISVFIEPVGPETATSVGASSSGAINVFRRTLGTHVVTALGEVPARAVQRLAEGIESVSR
ncbi:MAG: MucB/RseB C-terminal domain-containing protein [Azoarcus sp.]|jgi:sigma-E factor negative regulatory protein RseB|nr:MucB/RseB C-terminal domain-containing protein [Azoarcus sp.]